MGKLTKTSIDKQFQDQVRDMIKPGTSALFLMLEKVTPDKAVEATIKYAAPSRRRPCPRRTSGNCRKRCTARRPRSSPDDRTSQSAHA